MLNWKCMGCSSKWIILQTRPTLLSLNGNVLLQIITLFYSDFSESITHTETKGLHLRKLPFLHVYVYPVASVVYKPRKAKSR